MYLRRETMKGFVAEVDSGHPSILLSFTFMAISTGFSRAGGSNAKPSAILG
jgi:hypothetical protein